MFVVMSVQCYGERSTSIRQAAKAQTRPGNQALGGGTALRTCAAARDSLQASVRLLKLLTDCLKSSSSSRQITQATKCAAVAGLLSVSNKYAVNCSLLR